MSLSKTSLRKIFSVVVLAVFGFSLALISRFVFQSPTWNDPVPIALGNIRSGYQRAEVRSGRPVRLMIPRINVASAVEYVGIVADGAMGAPKKPKDVAWFEPGPRPGERGSAVIAGHYGWKNGESSAFDNLHKLREGDELSVEDENGVVIKFVVSEIRSYDPQADASEVFNSNDGKAHLNLITCEGIWDNISKKYPKRLVVFADKALE